MIDLRASFWPAVHAMQNPLEAEERLAITAGLTVATAEIASDEHFLEDVRRRFG